MGGVICSDSEMFGLSEKKCTYANTALGFPATRQSTVAMQEGGYVNITHNTITVHSHSLVVVVVSSSEKLNNSLFHGQFARWRKWRACDVEAKEGLENELWRRWSDEKVGEWARAELILQPFRHFTYVTAHSPILLSLLRHRHFTHATWRAAHGCHSKIKLFVGDKSLGPNY